MCIELSEKSSGAEQLCAVIDPTCTLCIASARSHGEDDEVAALQHCWREQRVVAGGTAAAPTGRSTNRIRRLSMSSFSLFGRKEDAMRSVCRV